MKILAGGMPAIDFRRLEKYTSIIAAVMLVMAQCFRIFDEPQFHDIFSQMNQLNLCLANFV